MLELIQSVQFVQIVQLVHVQSFLSLNGYIYVHPS